MNGCSGVTGDVWQHVNAASSASAAVVGGQFSQHAPQHACQHAPQHALRSLSLVGCKGMRTCLLGLKPAVGRDAPGPGQGQTGGGTWLPAACHLSGLSLALKIAPQTCIRSAESVSQIASSVGADLGQGADTHMSADAYVSAEPFGMRRWLACKLLNSLWKLT